MGDSSDRQTELLQGIWDEMKSLHLSLKKELGETRTELKQELAETRTELKQELVETRRELKQELAQTNQRITELDLRLSTELVEVAKTLKDTNHLIRQWGNRLRTVETRVEELS